MKRFISIVLAVVVLSAAAAVSTLPVQPASAVSSAALSIVPRKNYTIEPGKSVNDTLVIRNLDSAEPLELSLRVVDFTFTDDGGTPKLMLAEDAPQTTWSLKPYMTVPKTVTIAPNSSETLDMSVEIPAGHGAGSFYSAIVYSSGASDEGNVGLSASGVTLVFTTIPGDVDENLNLEKFGAYKQAEGDKAAGYKFLNFEKPKLIAYTLNNKGNVAESPVGSITLKGMFGDEQVIHDINPNKSLALIGQTRTFTSCIKLIAEEIEFNGQNTKTNTCASPTLWPGRYSVTIDAFYGQNGNRTQEITSTASFWYLPVWFVIIMIIVLGALGFGIYRVVTIVRSKLYGTSTKKRSRRR